MHHLNFKMKRQFAWNLAFCLLALLMILSRPYLAGVRKNGRLVKPGHTYATLQRVIKKNDSHEATIEAKEIQNAADKHTDRQCAFEPLAGCDRE